MGIMSDFQINMAQIMSAVDAGLLETGDQGKDVLQSVIYENVYSYPASTWAMRKRRYDDGGLGDKNNMIPSVTDVDSRTRELQIENFAGLQDYGSNFRGDYNPGGYGPAPKVWGDRLDEIVETGDKSYRQPYPRPFYKDAEKQIVDGGLADGCIASALLEAGFDVTVI